MKDQQLLHEVPISVATSIPTSHRIIDTMKEDNEVVSLSTSSIQHIDVITKLVKKTISLNHNGVICLESNKIKSAIKIFTAACNTHEKLKIKMNNMNRNNTNNRSVIGSSDAAAAAATSPDTTTSYHNNNVNELFYQYRRAPSSSSRSSLSSSSSSSGSSSSSTGSLSYMPSLEEVMDMDMDLYLDYNDNDNNNNIHRIDNDCDEANTSTTPPIIIANSNVSESEPVSEILLDIDDEIIFRDSIRLPFYEDFPTSTFELHPSHEEDNNPAFSFLSTCHTLNLAIAHHLRGIELLLQTSQQEKQQRQRQQRKIVSSISTDDNENKNEDEDETIVNHRRTSNSSSRRRRSASKQYCYNKHFIKAIHLYEQTMNIERIRSKQQQQDSSLTSKSISTSWFSPQILLACLNNLGHLHSLMSSSRSSSRSSSSSHRQEQSHQCYERLQSTVRKLVITTMESSNSSDSSLTRRRSMSLISSTSWRNLIREEEENLYSTSSSSSSLSNDNDCDCDCDTTNDDIDIEDTYTYLELFWTNSFNGLNRLLSLTASVSQHHPVRNVPTNDKPTPTHPSSTSLSTPKSITIPKPIQTIP